MSHGLKHQDLIREMTLEEKAGLLSGRDIWSTKPLRRLGIPELYLSDGPHGLRKQVGTADHLGLNASLPATCFPTASTIANSWNEKLGERIGEQLGEEAVSRNVQVVLGPGLNIKRSPLCGRNFEYFSEDPYLSGKMAAAYIRGIQKNHIAACPKHFAVNSQESLRMINNSILDERTLREIYLTGFEIAVKEGKPKAIMSSYNRVNGVYANENAHLLQEILRDEWGFDGAVVTDWGGSNDHIAGVKAGSTLEMPGTMGDSDRQLVQAVKEGFLSEEELDVRADELLTLVSETAVTKDSVRKRPMKELKNAHHAAAQTAAEESIVLLKNDDDILPLPKGTVVGIIGEFAENPRYQGAGSSMVNPTRLESTLDTIKEFPLRMEGYARGYRRNREPDVKLIWEAVELAENTPVVILYLGLDEASESEGLDRTSLKLPEGQQKLLEAVEAVNQNIIVVLSAGSVIEMPWLKKCKALLYGGLGGQAQARAMLKALTGQINPSGKLAETYPLVYEDTPAYAYWQQCDYDSEYREALYVGYRYYETAGVPVRFPFGFGLSYTTFSYSNLEVSEKGVRFTVTNTGSRDGAEAAQLYIGKEESVQFRPCKELKGFTKIFLKAGEEKTVQIPFDDKCFRYYDIQEQSWRMEAGSYRIMVGASVQDIRLEGTCAVTENSLAFYPVSLGAADERRHLEELFPSYYSGRTAQVSKNEFYSLPGMAKDAFLLRDNKESASKFRILQMNDAICHMKYAKSRLARLVYRIINYKKERSERKEIPNLNILFIYNLPFRGIAKMMNGMVSMEMTKAVLVMVNGRFFKGMGLLIRAYFINLKNRKNYMHMNR